MVMPEVSRLNHCGEMEVEDGSLKFEVILEDAKTKKIPRPKSAPSPMPNYEEIQQKLKVCKQIISRDEKAHICMNPTKKYSLPKTISNKDRQRGM